MPAETQQSAARSLLHTYSAVPLLLQIALRRRKLILVASVVIALLGGTVALLLPRRYTATTVVLPPQQNTSSSAGMLAQLGNLGALASLGGGLSMKNPNDLQVSLLRSQTVEDAMIARFHLESLYGRSYLSTARKQWERKTSVDSGLKDGLLRLSVTDGDPRRAAALANGWVEEYRRMNASLAITEASQRRLFFERERDAARDDLNHAEDNLKQTEQRTGVIEIDGQARAMIASAAVLRAQVDAKQVEIRAMRQFAAGQNPDLERAEQELSGMQAQLDTMNATADRAEGDLSMPKGRITQDGLDYARALREMKYREAVYELLTREYEVARVDEARQGSLVQIVDPALVPDRPSSAYRIWIAAAAFLCALPCALLLACCAELATVMRGYRRRSSSWIDALEQACATVSSGGAR
ncbi:MAG TPA: Wzz/FepE/Etk N-terminal domain-containing protein [Terracidiphilus sp.]|nr:Wzz/FepE/Etk N-terminal domain-containing protein [Terracidiphilus sp.]